MRFSLYFFLFLAAAFLISVNCSGRSICIARHANFVSASMEPPALGIGLDFQTMVQQSGYINTDFTGISNFEYKRKFQWQIGFGALCKIGERWFLGFGFGLKDVGMYRKNYAPNLEPFVIGTKYNFIYGYFRTTVSRRVMESRKGELCILATVEPQWKLSDKQIVYYKFQDPYTQDPSQLFPVNFSAGFSIGGEFRRYFDKNLMLGFEYNLSTGVPKYRKEIYAGFFIQHAITIKIYLVRHEK